MIKHIVMWRLQENAAGNTKEQNAQLIKEKLEALNGQIEGLSHLEVGINFTEGEAAFDVALYSTFPDKAALQFYATHPLHLEVVEFVKSVVSERIVADYED